MQSHYVVPMVPDDEPTERHPRTGIWARYRRGIRAGLPFAPTIVVLGVSFGVLARAEGIGVLPAVAMSALTFAASAQFAAVSVFGAGGGVLAAVVAGVLLNARYGPMGVALAPSMRGGAVRRAVDAQAMVDTSWALASRGGGRFDRHMLIGATIPQYPAWVGGTAIGVVGGSLIGDPERFGLDAIFTTFFLALLARELSDRRAVAVAVLAALVALALLPVAPPGVPVIAACAAALVGLRWR